MVIFQTLCYWIKNSKKSRSNKIFYTDGLIYYVEQKCYLGSSENVPNELKNDASMINKLYKIDTSTGNKTFVDYVKYDGAVAC